MPEWAEICRDAKFDGVERPFAPGIKDAYCDDANRHMIEGTIPWTRLPQSDWI
ncbi:hypothetical protein TRICHSKD4_6107 [Roseibium sp. TrichSKD4]|nr:hypothetical protein TRICHSKD4_6107 [Roseibium sp. TrichSKD4]